MNFFKRLFGKKELVTDTESFWKWFQSHERSFHAAVNGEKPINEVFLDHLMPKLEQLNAWFACSAGMTDTKTAELIITAQGDIKTFVFAEELVAAAPVITGWKFTALKPPTGLAISIEMDGYTFNDKKMSFISRDNGEYPDEIELTMVHRDLSEENKDIITNGTFIFLDNALGELNTATLIDNIQIAAPEEVQEELIPLEKLQDFLTWKEKEFVEKYNGARHNTQSDSYSILEAKDEKGLPSIALVNQELLDWDAKASHPWMMVIELSYKPINNGMPDKGISAALNRFEDELVRLLADSEGYLNLGRDTYNSKRSIYFACKEFRHASKTVHGLLQKYSGEVEITYDIYKDKYWRTMNRYRSSF
ncbi:MAG TPA: DUF695 domain-containing protein [Puia sp.]|nr:DUF695 domain-containing protein [Puia sp.]